MASLRDSDFKLVVMDSQGRMSTIVILAQDEANARQLAELEGHTILECERALTDNKHERRDHRWSSFGRSSKIDTVAFSQDLATLLEAGVTVRDAIHALTRRETSTPKYQVFQQINAALTEGLPLSTALERSNAFPALLIATILASEQTGDLAVGLSRYARHQQSLSAVRERVVGACVYPALLLAVGAGVVVMLLGVVVPRFASLIDSSGKELPLLSKILMAWGRFVDANPMAFGVLLTALGIFAFYLTTKLFQPGFRQKWLSAMPGIRGYVREFQHLQMYRTTAILTSRGIPVHKALLMCLELLNPGDRQRLQKSLADLREGIAISVAFTNSGLSDTVATSMLSVAERTGSLPEMLDRIGDFYERTLQRNIDIASRLIEPVLMIFLGLIIGGIVVLMYLPIFDLASSIS